MFVMQLAMLLLSRLASKVVVLFCNRDGTRPDDTRHHVILITRCLECTTDNTWVYHTNPVLHQLRGLQNLLGTHRPGRVQNCTGEKHELI
jgi:hypothetical protein